MLLMDYLDFKSREVMLSSLDSSMELQACSTKNILRLKGNHSLTSAT